MLYDYQPVSLATSGASFTYTSKSCLVENLVSWSHCNASITLQTPDPDPRNWALHVSSIWVSSTYLADHLDELKLESYIHWKKNSIEHVRVLELGASAGLPAKLYSDCGKFEVTVTDYPDKNIMKKKSATAVVRYLMGTDPNPLLDGVAAEFDVVIAADTLWNPELHEIFIKSLRFTLKRSPDSAKIQQHISLWVYTHRTSRDSVISRKGSTFWIRCG